MNKFAYRARDVRGALVRGVMEGDSREVVLSQLDSLGLVPVRVTEQQEIMRSSGRILLKFTRVKFDDLIFFTRQLQTVIRSGIPLLAGLEALEEQTSSRPLKLAIGDVRRDIDKGQRLSDALGRHKKIFPEVYVSMVRAGEIGGSLEEVLERLSSLLEFQMKTKEMLKAAIRYPIFVISTLIIAFIVLIVFVIPRFAGFFKSLKAELPLPTRIMLFISEIVEGYGLFLLLGAVAIAVLVGIALRSERGALLFDRFKLKIPLMGPIVLKICMSRFAAMLENLVKVGVPIVKSLEIVTKTIGNRYIGAKVAEISANIEKGKGISKSLKDTGVFPPLVLHLVATGEDTGSLEEMLKEVYYHYDREVTYSINRLSAWIEPILVAGLSLMVLFMALAIFMPWWNMMGALRTGG
jgi:MSHA biogenesis protein MshG